MARLKFTGERAQDGAWVSRPSARWGSPPGEQSERRNHGMQADWLRQTGALAWLVHDALPPLAFRPADGRADSVLHAEG